MATTTLQHVYRKPFLLCACTKWLLLSCEPLLLHGSQLAPVAIVDHGRQTHRHHPRSCQLYPHLRSLHRRPQPRWCQQRPRWILGTFPFVAMQL